MEQYSILFFRECSGLRFILRIDPVTKKVPIGKVNDNKLIWYHKNQGWPSNKEHERFTGYPQTILFCFLHQLYSRGIA